MVRPYDRSTFVFLSSRTGESLGRVERRMLAVMAELLRRGSTILVICVPRSPLAEQAASLGATVAPYRLEAGSYLRVASRMRKYLRRYMPVCAHSTGLRADVLVRWAARGLPVGVVNSIPCGAWPRGGPIRHRLDRHTLSRPDTFMVDCIELGVELQEAGVFAERIVYDPPSVTVARVVAESEKPSPVARGDRPMVGFASRLEISRGVGHLVDAAALLAERGTDAEVVIAGRGPSLADIRERAAPLDSVRVLGEVESLPSVLREFDVCVFPSIGGGAPTALVEAAVLGRPIVASAVPGIEGLFAGGDEIVLVPPADATALAAAIERLLSDPVAAAAMGQRARLRAIDEYSSAAAVQRHPTLYRDFRAR